MHTFFQFHRQFFPTAIVSGPKLTPEAFLLFLHEASYKPWPFHSFLPPCFSIYSTTSTTSFCTPESLQYLTLPLTSFINFFDIPFLPSFWFLPMHFKRFLSLQWGIESRLSTVIFRVIIMVKAFAVWGWDWFVVKVVWLSVVALNCSMLRPCRFCHSCCLCSPWIKLILRSQNSLGFVSSNPSPSLVLVYRSEQRIFFSSLSMLAFLTVKLIF